KDILREHGRPILFLSDEFFLRAGLRLPSYANSEVLHQHENGVGMVWDFYRRSRRAAKLIPARLPKPRRIAWFTSELGHKVLERSLELLRPVKNLSVVPIILKNSLFGPDITVTGLLPGEDFLAGITANKGYDAYVIPGNSLRTADQIFLDDLSIAQLRTLTGARLEIVDGDALELIERTLAI
ncbi:MAG: DUF512 domain-containing protein, partial [bacterium]